MFVFKFRVVRKISGVHLFDFCTIFLQIGQSDVFMFCRELGENMTDEELRAMIDEFDRDGDGESKYYY